MNKNIKRINFFKYIIIIILLFITNCSSSIKFENYFNHFDNYCNNFYLTNYYENTKKENINKKDIFNFIKEISFKYNNIWNEYNLNNFLKSIDSNINQNKNDFNLASFLKGIVYLNLNRYPEAYNVFNQINKEPYLSLSKRYKDFALDQIKKGKKELSEEEKIKIEEEKVLNELIKKIDEKFNIFLLEYYDIIKGVIKIIFDNFESSDINLMKYEKVNKLKMFLYNKISDEIDKKVGEEIEKKKKLKIKRIDISQITLEKINLYFEKLNNLEIEILYYLFNFNINNLSNISKIFYFLSLINLLKADYNDFLNYLALSFISGGNYYYSILSYGILNSIIVNESFIDLESLIFVDQKDIYKNIDIYFYKNTDDFFKKNNIEKILKPILEEKFNFKTKEINETINLLKLLINLGFYERFLNFIFYFANFSENKILFYEINRNFSFFIGNLNYLIYYQNLIFLENSTIFYNNFKNISNLSSKIKKQINDYSSDKYFLCLEKKIVNSSNDKNLETNNNLNDFLNNTFYIDDEILEIYLKFISKRNLYDYLFSYPYFYIDLIKSNNNNNYFNKLEILSLLREESYFKSDSVSSAGAIGLMQLMPSTAYQLYYNKSYKYDKNFIEKLKDPEFSINLGIKYLDIMYKTFNSKSLAFSSYNGGPNRMKRLFGNKDFFTFIDVEFINISETQIYLKKIIRSYIIYNFLYENINFVDSISYIIKNW